MATDAGACDDDADDDTVHQIILGAERNRIFGLQTVEKDLQRNPSTAASHTIPSRSGVHPGHHLKEGVRRSISLHR